MVQTQSQSQQEDEHLIFASLYKTNNIEEALENQGLIAQYEQYCFENGNITEGNSWKLVQELLLQRAQYALDSDLYIEQEKGKWDSEIALKMIESSLELQELYVVKNWLEQTFPEFIPCEIKLKNSNVDPDFPTRTKQPEHSNFNQDLNKTIFQYIKRGQLQEALELLKSCKLYWKAAALRGSILRFDPTDDQVPNGNQNRVLWKAIALKAASDEQLDMYTRAVYAILCGDVKNATPACQTLQDYLWVHVTCLMEHKIQQKLYENAELLVEVPPVLLKIPHYPWSLKDVFDGLLNHDRVEIRETLVELFHSFQMHFILNDMQTFFYSIQEQLSVLKVEEIDDELKKGLRFLTHVIMLLRHLDLETDTTITNMIIQKYILLLQSEYQYELVPLFYEFLPRNEQIFGYALFLSGIQDNKSTFYQLGLDHGLDMLEISIQTVSQCLTVLGQELPQDIPEVEVTSLDKDLSEQEMNEINSLEWLGFEDSQIEHLVQFSNSLMRRYLMQGKIHCVLSILNRFSVEGEDLLDESMEQMNFQQLIRCFELYANWEMIFDKCPIGNTIEFTSWKLEIKEATTETFNAITDLVQSTTFGTPLEQFNDPREYEIIRGMYVPKLILWAHDINYRTKMYFPEHLEKCFELVELVANDSTVNIFTSFMVSGKMSLFLDAVKEAAVASLEFKQMPWSSV